MVKLYLIDYLFLIILYLCIHVHMQGPVQEQIDLSELAIVLKY